METDSKMLLRGPSKNDIFKKLFNNTPKKKYIFAIIGTDIAI